MIMFMFVTACCALLVDGHCKGVNSELVLSQSCVCLCTCQPIPTP